jgi:digeranylgeranylglycerophospholipid reductase
MAGTYDVIVVGAGPSGLMAARELGQSDVSYLVIESKDQIGYPLRCGETTREETFTELLGHSAYPFIKNKINTVSFQIGNTRRLMKKTFFMLDRPRFLQWLSVPVENHLRLNTKLESLSIKNGGLEAITNKGVVQAKLAVIASGTGYRLQRKLGLLKRDIELVPCIGGLFKNTTLDPETACFHYDEESFVATWFFPKGENVVNAGAGQILKNRRTARHNLGDAFRKVAKKRGIPLEGELSFVGTYVTSGPLRRTYADRLLFCGDAAGQVFAGIGEGIYFALKAGQIAGRTAVEAVKHRRFDSDFLQTYQAGWQESFGRQMDSGVVFATVLFFLMRHHLTHKALKIIKPNEIRDMWIEGHCSLRLKLFYFFLRSLACARRR